ncbi:Glycosyl transferase family 2 [Rubripirellula tenax]|uniref:Glycosyl transferase family 2 n=1 Tax=Rubripirellula tenax TaxID=2528015 RepID=A0A5C6F6J7_9BACT|nr:glycosyltransferase [Rubripirellula tenax]TWU56875.1 Glycosyl transferase family 2 [Rubripirellula tenax]
MSHPSPAATIETVTEDRDRDIKAVDLIGVVAIGRNEGERLRCCLQSIQNCNAVVYVDSNSSDDSVALAKQFGVEVVELDMSQPFSAARARNEGFARLMETFPATKYVQFVDGDCEMSDGWLQRARDEFGKDPKLAVVGGRIRERYPDQSLYNRLCDIEWNTPIGDAKSVGGNAVMRTDVVQSMGGYNPTVIAGEEPELCVRIRADGWKIRRIDAEMARHDAAITRFKQWWRRMQRSGHAYAQGAMMHGGAPEFHWVRETRSICFWGCVVPVIALLLAWPTWGLSLGLFAGYAALIRRVGRYYRGRGFSKTDSRLAAIFDVLAKFPQFVGVVVFRMNHLRSKNTELIEYKGATS